MSRNRNTSARSDALAGAFREALSQEIRAQAGQVPSARSVLLLARFEAQVQRRARTDALASWLHALLLGAFAGLLAVGWLRFAAAPPEMAEAFQPWSLAIGLSALLVPMALLWSRRLFRTG